MTRTMTPGHFCRHQQALAKGQGLEDTPVLADTGRTLRPEGHRGTQAGRLPCHHLCPRWPPLCSRVTSPCEGPSGGLHLPCNKDMMTQRTMEARGLKGRRPCEVGGL